MKHRNHDIISYYTYRFNTKIKTRYTIYTHPQILETTV